MTLIRLRLLLLLAGVGALLTGLPSLALTSPAPGAEATPASAASARALTLLESAARAAHARSWSGTQHVVTVRDGQPSFTVLQVRHTPETGSSVQVLWPGQNPPAAVTADTIDAQLLGVLAAHFDLRVAGQDRCAGRRALVIEVHRPGQTGAGALAGRFLLDADTHLVLRREVFDATGSVIRSSAFVDMRLGEPVTPASAAIPALAATGQRLDDDALQALQEQGWPVVRTLPSGLELFEARLHDSEGAGVLQLSYSDGLSTLSLFVQEGQLAQDPGGTPRTMGGGTVWLAKGSPQKAVWSGAGRTWTLVSDAPARAVTDALLVLPHNPSVGSDGVGARVWRGMSRVGRWLNPFD